MNHTPLLRGPFLFSFYLISSLYTNVIDGIIQVYIIISTHPPSNIKLHKYEKVINWIINNKWALILFIALILKWKEFRLRLRKEMIKELEVYHIVVTAIIIKAM